MIASATGERIIRVGFWVAAVAVAAVPLVCGVVAIRAGWTAISDQAVIAARSMDTLTSDPPLVGMPTSLSVQAGQYLYHPGPLPFWIFALPGRLLGEPGYGLVAATAVVNASALATIMVLVRRTLGPLAAIGSAVVLAGFMHSFSAGWLRDPFNPLVGALPLLVLIVATWSVVAGHPKAVLPAALFGSLAGQAHVANLIAFGGLGLLCVVAIALDWRKAPSGGPARRALERWSAGAGVALLVCWSGPLVDQLFGDGNLMGLVRGGSDVEPSGVRFGIERLLDAIAPLPVWIRSADAGADLDRVRSMLGLLMLAALVALGAWTLRSGRRAQAALMGTALASAALGAATASRLPADSFSQTSPANNLQWWPVSAIVWFALAVGLVAVGQAVSRGSAALGGEHSTRLAGAVATMAAVVMVPLVAVTGVVTVVDQDVASDTGSVLWGPVRTHPQAIDDSVPDGGTAILALGDAPPPAAVHYLTSLVGQLRLRGVRVRFATEALPNPTAYEQYREVGDEEGAVVMLIRSGPDAARPVPGHRRISYWDPADPSARYDGYEETLFFAGTFPSAIFLETRP